MSRTASDRIYEATARWVDIALMRDGSLFTPSEPIWAPKQIEDLYQRYNLLPENSSGLGFDAKLRRQLESAPDTTIQLMAEVTYVSLLVVDDISAPTKLASVEKILELMERPVAVPKDLADVLDRGIAAGGLGWKTMRWAQLAYLVAFARQWKTMPLDEQRAALGDAWKFKSILATVPIESGYAQREALLHLVFPDVFEDSVSREHKKKIRDAFQTRASERLTGDVDRDLFAIRQALSEEYGTSFSFYDPEISPIWDPVATDERPWDEFIGWARKIHDWAVFDADEYDYKIEDGQRVAASLLAAASDSPEWLGLAATALKATNLVRWQASDSLVQWWEANPGAGREMLSVLQNTQDSVVDKARNFLDHLPNNFLSSADLLRIVSFFFLGIDAKQYPPAGATTIAKACKLTGFPAPSPGVDPARRYRDALSFFDRLAMESEKRGLKLRNRLDAQSVTWALVEGNPPPTLDGEERSAFLAWRSGESSPRPTVDASKAQPDTESPPLSLQQLADELLVPEEFLATVLTLLRERRQLILYGPPGTGKTYIARKLMEFIAPAPERHTVVQFHPSYSYEDFVEGYRPSTSSDGRLTYTLQPGPLLRLARAAQVNKQEHVLLIDEINRGNLPRILGELLYALEYRGEPVIPMYSPDTPLVLPKNLLVIGTMNTADKSIGLIDAALRRRFHFVPLFPGEGPLGNLLSLWLDQNLPQMRHVAAIVDQLNFDLRKQVGRQLQLGHSYFLREDLSEEVLARIWQADVIPFLEDQFFGREEDLAQFQLDRLRKAANEDSEAEGVESAEGGADEP